MYRQPIFSVHMQSKITCNIGIGVKKCGCVITFRHFSLILNHPLDNGLGTGCFQPERVSNNQSSYNFHVTLYHRNVFAGNVLRTCLP